MGNEERPRGFGTRAIGAATRPPRLEQEPGTVPIYQAAAFHGRDTEDLAAILADERRGFAYSRHDNPTAAALAAAFAELHGAEDGFAFGSGMAAIHATILSLVRAGDRIVTTGSTYGTTRTLLTGRFESLGVEVVMAGDDPASVERAVAERPTRLVYTETISNPTTVVADLAAIAAIAHAADAVLAVDDTFASPYLCQPIDHGADLVIESATKWLGGHSDVTAGVVAGSTERIDAIRQVAVDTGGILAPFSAFLVLRGLQTLHVRMDRHSASAFAVARHLQSRPEVVRVLYPGLPNHPQAALAQRQLRAGGGMLAFEMADRATAAAFIDALEIPPTTATLGSVITYIVHPPSSTHRQLSDAELTQSGIPPGLVRCSVGLEDVEDLIADIDAALSVSARTGITA